ncbi:MAG: ABC transporter permease subunit, partial [Oscillospiraceae bacterium]|nr:ABC transporter permease subunit [Oscillospiraceae bacterium]
KYVDISGLTGENGSITVTGLTDNVPFVYTSSNQEQGYAVELVTMFARKYGYSVEYELGNVTSCLAGMASGKYDICAGSFSVTEERRQSMDFSDVVYSGGVVLVLRSEDKSMISSDEKKISDYDGKVIGVQTGTVFDEMIGEKLPNSEISYYNSYTDMIASLKSGIIDAFATDEPMAKAMMAEDKSLGYLDDYLDDYSFAFAFPKTPEGEALCGEFSEYLNKAKSNGTLEEIEGIWFDPDDSRKMIPDPHALPADRGELYLALESAFAPFCYVKDNSVVGYEVDIAYRFCKEYGYGLDLVDMNFDAVIPSIASGKCNFGCSGISVTEERRESVNFSVSDYDGGSVLAVRAEDLAGTAQNATVSAGPSFSDYNGKVIGVQTGTVFDEMVKENIPGAEISYYNSYTDLLSALKAGLIDGFAGDEPMVKYMMTEDGSVGYLSDYMDSYSFAFAFSKDDDGEKLCDEFSEYIRKIRSDGTLQKIDQTWFGTDESAKVIPDIEALSADNGKLSLATEAANAPFVYMKDNQIVGYEIDIAYRFCNEYGYGLDIIDMNFDGIIPAVSGGKNDFACATIAITEERRESVNFSDSHYDGGSVLAVRAEDLVNSTASDIAPKEETKTSWIEAITSSFNKNFIREDRYKLILEGIKTTCIITFLSVIFGSLIAFLICMFRRLDSVLSNKMANLYVKLLQGTPMVVLLMILYYVVFGRSGIDAIWVAVIGFSLNFAAYVSEILRSGIDSIDGGQREAALALGFSENQAFFRFIFPQAAVRQLSVYRGEIISLLKNTSIVGYIAIQDLTKMSDIIRSRTYEAFFPLIVTAVIYFILAWVIALILKLILRQLDPKTRKRGRI